MFHGTADVVLLGVLATTVVMVLSWLQKEHGFMKMFLCACWLASALLSDF